MSDPLVSVLMACRNSVPFVGDAIDSVLAQGYPNIELVAVDDASDDATPDVLAGYARAHPAVVRTARNERQQGIPSVRRRALGMARGSLICVLDADDSG